MKKGKLKLRLSVKDLASFSTCPYKLLNRSFGVAETINIDVIVGCIVHEARTKLNPIKRRLVLINITPEEMRSIIMDVLNKLRSEGPFDLNVKEVGKSLSILNKEWEWEQRLMQTFSAEEIIPVKMEVPVKFPPGIYGRIDGLLFSNGYPSPIEYKTRDIGLGEADRFQLACYCAGVSFKYRADVRYGILQYSSPPRRERVAFTEEIKEKILRTYEKAVSFLETGEVSGEPSPRACSSCLYFGCKQRRDGD